MVKGHKVNMGSQVGSATVEAVVGFTAFLFAIFTILGMTKFCRAQMLISSAVDTAAKEMSQYAYFYEMSGLQKFEGKLDNNAEVGKENINEIIGTVDTLYSSITGTVDQTIEDQTAIANMASSGQVDFGKLESAVKNVGDNVEEIAAGIEGVGQALADVGSNPLLYMRSLVAIIGSEAAEGAKRAVAVPLAKMFVSRHFGSNTEEVNDTLESLGIEGGLNSMNFNLSNIFSDAKHQDIELNVLYKVKLLQIFDWVVLEANVSKVAVCRAWLAGDAVVQKASATSTVTLGTKDSEGQPGQEPSNPGNPEVSEPVEDDSQDQVDLTGSYWHLGDGGYGVENAGRDKAFLDLFYETYGIDQNKPGWYYQQADSEGNATGQIFYPDCTTTSDNPEFDAAFVAAEAKAIQDMINDGTLPDTVSAYTYVLYVPENMPEEEYNKMVEEAERAVADYYALLAAAGEEASEGLADIPITISIVRAGGNYDYGSEEP